jgi:hypothetical protein
MTEVAVKISEKYKLFVDNNPEVINELLSEYIEKEQDKKTYFELKDNKIDLNLNLQLKSVL